MKKLLLSISLILSLVIAKAQNERFPYNNSGFPYNEDKPIFNSDVDTTQGVKRVNRLLNILNEFRIDAFIQTEWQRTDTAGGGAGSVKGISGVQGGQFPASANNRFLLRRARLRLAYEHKNAKDLKVIEFAFQFEGTEKGFAVKELYGRVNDPWTGWFGIQAGIFKRQFGFETPATSQFFESPEVARVNQVIFPQDYELGADLIIESPAKFTKFYFRADAELINGNGIGLNTTVSTTPPSVETGAYASKKDFIGRVKAAKAWDLNGGSSEKHGTTFAINGSLSYYGGGVLQSTKNVFGVVNGTFRNLTAGTSDTSLALKAYYAREYYGAQVEGKADYYIGTSALRAEYITGTQPGYVGSGSSSTAPVGVNTSVPGVDLYLRHFNGASFLFVQTFKNHLKDHIIYHDIAVKFDWYNPNTAVKQSELTSAAGFTSTDVKYSTLGLGYTFAPYSWFKVVVWYDYVINSSTQLAGYRTNYSKDNVLTVRTQFNIDTKWFGAKSKYKDNLLTKNY